MMTVTQSTEGMRWQALDVLADSKELTLQKHVETNKSGNMSGNNTHDESMHMKWNQHINIINGNLSHLDFPHKHG